MTRLADFVRQDLEDAKAKEEKPTPIPGYLKPLLDAQLASARPSRWSPWIRCSDLGKDFCPRLVPLALITDVEPVNIIPPEVQNFFDVGTDIHARMQNKRLGPLGVLFGQWTCLKCGMRSLPMTAMPGRCGCGGRKFEFYEEFLRDPEYLLCGHSDGGVSLPKTHEMVVGEFKSIAGEALDNMTRPYDSHIYQAHGYLHLNRVAGRDYKKVLFIYIAKTKRKTLSNSVASPYREFLMEENPAITQDILNRAAAQRDGWNRLIQQVVQTPWMGEKEIEPLLPRRICKKSTSARAKQCPLQGPCFR